MPKNKNKPTMADALIQSHEKRRHSFGIERQDDFYSKIAGVGGQYDVGSSTFFSDDGDMTMHEMEALYNKNWVAAKVIDKPVEDMFSKWIEFTISNEDDEGKAKRIEEVESIIEDYDVKKKIKEAFKEKRNHRGAAIFFDYGDDQRLPLTKPSLKKLRRIEVLNSWYCFPQSYFRPGRNDVDPHMIGRPEHYKCIVQNEGYTETVDVHHSRLIILDGRKPSSRRKRIERRGWGLSELEPFYNALKSYGISFQGATDAAGEFFWKVLKINGLAELIAANATDEIITHAQMSINTLGGRNIGIFGDDEELRRESATLSGLPEVMDRFANQICAACNPSMPWSVMFSNEGGALGGSSAEADQKNYFQSIEAMQNGEGREALNKFLYFLEINPKEYPYEFVPVYQMSPKEQKDLEKIQSEIDTNNINSGLMIVEEVRESRFSKDKIDLTSYKIDKELYQEIEEERLNDMVLGEGDIQDPALLPNEQ
jgi:uncharacterized protein